jgi:hypothetical protein
MKTISRLLVTTATIAAYTFTIGALPASAATGTPDDELTIDCNDDSGERFEIWNYVETQITVNFTNCDYHQHLNSDGDVITEDIPVSPIIMYGGDRLDITSTPLPAWITVVAGQLKEGRTPPGVLQYRQDVTIPLDAKTFDAGEIDDQDEEEHWLGGKRSCALDVGGGARHVYTTLNITIDRPGRYTFRSIATDPLGEYLGTDTNPIGDSFFALYSNFDPANPDEGVIGCNDDLNNLFDHGNELIVEVLEDGTWMEGHQPYFSVELEPGSYTLLMTTWRAVSKTEWINGEVENELPWTPGPATLTYELWGPAEAICVENDPVCDPPEPTLPPTGSSSGPATPIALISVMLGLVGVFAVRRRVTS